MTIQYNLKKESISGQEFLNTNGPLTDVEIKNLIKNRETVIGRIEPIAVRLERYRSYFDLSTEEVKELADTFAKEAIKSSFISLDLQELLTLSKQSKTSKPIFYILLTYSQLIIECVDEDGKSHGVKSISIEKLCNGSRNVNASVVFNWIGDGLKEMVYNDKTKTLISKGMMGDVIFLTTHAFDEKTGTILRLDGRLKENTIHDPIFGITPEDPITGVPVKELINFALQAREVPLSCNNGYVVTDAVLVSTLHQSYNYDPHAFLCVYLMDGFSASVTEWDQTGNAFIKRITFDNCIIPANNIDQIYNFMEYHTTRSNFIGCMLSDEAVADLVRMTFCHVRQDKVMSDLCWVRGSLSIEQVIAAAYGDTAAHELNTWAGGCTEEEVKMFRDICCIILNRKAKVLSAVIAGCAESSGRCYDAYGTLRCIVAGSTINRCKPFLDSVTRITNSTIEHGAIEIVADDGSHLRHGCAMLRHKK